MNSGSIESATERAWQLFEANLGPCLADLDEDEFLIIARKSVNQFVQFAAQGAFGMRLEAACNLVIEPPEARLSVEDYECMRKLGWSGATETLAQTMSPDRDPDGSPNFFIDAEVPIDYAGLASLSVATLRQVYHVNHPGDLQYSSFSSDNIQIRFPPLRIKRCVG